MNGQERAVRNCGDDRSPQRRSARGGGLTDASRPDGPDLSNDLRCAGNAFQGTRDCPPANTEPPPRPSTAHPLIQTDVPNSQNGCYARCPTCETGNRCGDVFHPDRHLH